MSALPTPLWLQNFTRQAGIRRAIVLHGNTLDVSLDPHSGQYVGVPDIAGAALRRAGFEQVVQWNRTDGIRGISPEQQQALYADAAGPAPAAPLRASAYDMGGSPPVAAPGRPIRWIFSGWCNSA